MASSSLSYEGDEADAEARADIVECGPDGAVRMLGTRVLGAGAATRQR